MKRDGEEGSGEAKEVDSVQYSSIGLNSEYIRFSLWNIASY